MKSEQQNYLIKDITLFGVMVGIVAAVITSLYFYDQSTNAFSEFAKSVYGLLG